VSSIVREPLLGLPTSLPVPLDFRVWIASPAHAVAWLMHAAAMETAPLGADRGINPPGLCVSVEAMLAAMDQVQPGTRALVRHQPDPAIEAIVSGWPAAFAATRAPGLGFVRHGDLAGLIGEFIANDLAPTRKFRGL